MNSIEKSALWIWSDNNTLEKDQKVCFRKTILFEEPAEKIKLTLYADSRYHLWINGVYEGLGPVRVWPDHPCKDVYYKVFESAVESIQISVLVWHYGVSTSQYIHGPARLGVIGEVSCQDEQEVAFLSDTSWKCTEHHGYRKPVPRINVSQPWVEMVDDRFSFDWFRPEFDEWSWTDAVTVNDSNFLPIEKIPERDIPFLNSTIRLPQKKILERDVHCLGIGIRIDYKSAFYPDDRTTEDRIQTGYICSIVVSPLEQNAVITLADRIWPEQTERCFLNGREYRFGRGVRERDVLLEEGENIFLLDVSGARQRFTSDLHFLTESPIQFLSPLDGTSTGFCGLGPFETVEIGNIVCADGFQINYNNPDYIKAGKAGNRNELMQCRDHLHPVTNCLFDGVKLRSCGAVYNSIEVKVQTGSEILIDPTAKFDREIIFDMGGEVSGFLCFTLKVIEKTQLDVRFSEYFSHGHLEIPDDLDNSLRLNCSRGTRSFRSLVRRGFRYIALRVRSEGRVTIENLQVDERLFPVENRGDFQTTDEDLNEIWKMCRRTVALCSEDTFVDCPAYEQAFWIGDAGIMSLYYQYLFGTGELTRHCLLLAARSMELTEFPDCHLPAGVHLLLTAWVQMWFVACKDYWIHSSDFDFLSEIFPWLEKAAKRFLVHIDGRGLFSLPAWNMLDWADMDTPYRGTICHLNAGVAACLDIMSDLAPLMDGVVEAGLWTSRSKELRVAIDYHFWDDDIRAYRDCIHQDGRPSQIFSVQSNLMMMKYGCVVEDRVEAVREFILNPPKGAVTPGSPFLAHFYYDYLFSLGRGREALDGIARQWGVMLEHGTCWETFEGFYKDRLTRSYCHAWSSAPAYLFGKWILGIRPLTPGFKKILIAPLPSGLSKASGAVPIPAGNIIVNWKIEDKGLFCQVDLPEGIDWEFKPGPGDYKEARVKVVQSGNGGNND